jgi:phage tail-like protein
MAITENSVSALLDNLPAIFQEDREPGKADFRGRFLLAFERILLGAGEISPKVPQPGMEETIGGGSVDFSGTGNPVILAGLQRYFEAGFVRENQFLPEKESIPRDFLPWLAGWLALTLREDWDEPRQRELIAKASWLYRLRGTKRGVEEFLRIYTRLGVEIDELNVPFQIGVHSRVGVDTILDGGAPFYFHVKVLLPTPDPALIKKHQEIATAVVDLQKPAHTFYTLTVETPTFRSTCIRRLAWTRCWDYRDTAEGERPGCSMTALSCANNREVFHGYGHTAFTLFQRTVPEGTGFYRGAGISHGDAAQT